MGYALAGLLSGAGRGLEMVATTMEQRRRDALEAARQWAMERSRQQAQREGREDEQEFRMGLEQFTQGQTNLRTEATLRSSEDRAVLEEQGRDRRLSQQQGHDRAMEQLRQTNRVALAELESQLNMDETQARVAAELDAQMTRLGREVGNYEISRDGRMVAIARDGRTVLGQSPPGAFEPRRSAASNPSDPFGSPQQSAPPPAPSRSPATTYTEADVQTTMRAHNLSRAETIRRLEAAGFQRAQ